jgi:hypothetical protein
VIFRTRPNDGRTTAPGRPKTTRRNPEHHPNISESLPKNSRSRPKHFRMTPEENILMVLSTTRKFLRSVYYLLGSSSEITKSENVGRKAPFPNNVRTRSSFSHTNWIKRYRKTGCSETFLPEKYFHKNPYFNLDSGLSKIIIDLMSDSSPVFILIGYGRK